MTTLSDLLRACAPFNPLGSALTEAADLIDKLIEDAETIRRHDEEQARLIYWTRAEFEAYLSSIGLPAHPAGSTGNEHLDWLTDHLGS